LAFCGGRDVSVRSLPAFKPVFAVHPIAHPSQIDFSPGGRLLALKSTSGRIVILDAQTGRTLMDFRNQNEKEGSAALFSSCGRNIVSVSWGGLLSVRDSATGKLVFSHVREDRMLDHLSVPRDRRFFVYSVGRSPRSDSQPPPPEAVVLHSWPIQNDYCRELPRRWSFIRALQVSPLGQYLAVIYGAPPEAVEIYDIKRSIVVARRAVRFGGTGCSVGWSPDEKLLVINGDEQFLVLEMPNLTERYVFPFRYPCHVVISPSSRFLALGSWTKSFIVPLDHLPQFVEKMREKK